MARAAERGRVLGLALLLTLADPATPELVSGLAHPDPLVRMAAQRALVKEARRHGEDILFTLRQRTADPEIRRRLQEVQQALAEWLSLESVLAPFARARLSTGAFVRYLDHGVTSYGWHRPGHVVLDWGLKDNPAISIVTTGFESVCLGYLRGEITAPQGGDEPVFSCTLAYWAIQRDQRELARSLVLHARAKMEGPHTEAAFRHHVRAGLARAFGERATLAGRRGAPRVQLLELWRYAHLIDPEWRPAHGMVLGFEQLIAEDRLFVEPQSWRGAPHRKLVRYRIHQLRESTTSRWRAGLGLYLDKRALAVHELGWAAVPALIPLVEDTRPTRGMVRRKDGHRPMTHGDLARELLRRLTGRVVFRIEDGLAWWRTVKDGGAEHFYLKMLRHDGLDGIEARHRAAVALLRIDSIRFRGLVLDQAALEQGSGRARILATLRGHLDQRAHGRLLEFVGADEGGWRTNLVAAQLLWESCGQEYGLRVVAAELSQAKEIDAVHVRHAVRVLAGVQRGFVDRALVRLLRSPAAPVRLAAITQLARSRHPGVRAFLVAALDDTGPAHYRRKNTGKLRVCDLAAEALAEITRYPLPLYLPRDLVQRDARIQRLRLWITGALPIRPGSPARTPRVPATAHPRTATGR